MKNLFVFIFTILLSLPVMAQRDETILRNPSLKLTGIWGGSVNRINNFSGDSDYATGGFFTFEFNKDYLLGWDGFSVYASTDGIDDIKVSTNGLLLGYAYSGYQVIHPVAYLSIGRAISKADDLPTIKSFAGHASIGAEVNVFRWFKIGGEVGYRYVDPKDSWIEDVNLSSPYAGIKLKFGWSWGK